MRKDQWSKIQDDLDEQKKENEGATAGRAVDAVNNFRFVALRQYYYREWPTQGEIRDELERLHRMPTFERDALMLRAGFPAQAQYDANQAVMVRLNNGPKPIE